MDGKTVKLKVQATRDNIRRPQDRTLKKLAQHQIDQHHSDINIKPKIIEAPSDLALSAIREDTNKMLENIRPDKRLKAFIR